MSFHKPSQSLGITATASVTAWRRMGFVVRL